MARILLFESDKKLRNYLKDLLIKRNYEVKTPNKRVGVLGLIEKFQPDLLIFDGKEEGIAIESFCRKIRREYPNLPFVLLVEKLEVKRTAELHRAGVDDFIPKPIRTKTFLSRVRIQLTSKRTAKTEFRVADLTLNVRNLQVKRGSKLINLGS